MPYIKQSYRPQFNEAILLLKYGQYSECASQIILHVDRLEPKVMDGCLNYVFTQMLRKNDNLIDVKVIIDLIVNDLFWTEPSYFKFERVKGLFGCMIDEYKRRGWRRQRQVVKILKHFLKVNAHKTADYEDEKKNLNGDLD